MENLRVLSDCNAIMILDAGEKEKNLGGSILDCHVILGIHCLQKVCEPTSVTKEPYIFHTVIVGEWPVRGVVLAQQPSIDFTV